ncbi:uncharacterized protein LOC141664845 [Apium graveolens]|uniref:uncharacterized protein LOC141664845 n=1 Tax=Apium graveolens TaxID=4045 RepID=UPI003D799D25
MVYCSPSEIYSPVIQKVPPILCLKKASRSTAFEWNDECKSSFAELKAFLTNPHILTRPILGEVSRVYLSASDDTVAAILVRFNEGNKVPLYCISHSLRDAETRYPQRILHKPDMMERLAAWTIELSQFYIEYKPRTAIKAQVLSDFVVGCQFRARHSNPDEDKLRSWLLFVDGTSTTSSGGARIIIISLEGFKIQQALKFEFQATNNVAEYEALIAGLKLATSLEIEIIDIFGDSQLVAKQISGEFKTHNENMAKYLSITQELFKKFSSWKLSNVDRAENQWTDSLAKLASSNLQINLDPVYVDILTAPAFDIPAVNHIQNNPDWQKPLLEYILENKLPTEKNEARSVMFKARNYYTIGLVLYRRSLTEPLLRCLSPEEADQEILEVHTGIYGEHLGGKNLALKIIRQGLYWPTL